ncbi:hypothetical protein BHE74_00033187 [Ensete ventricosum]|uniref:Helicase ATP-binding domain-containing protein n=1 Tax=Ensete ventricosum TaxID=4639 RepID=A0A445MDP3_ENSVE|nr:hypothetical protein BHE74_00033187 [Ensete ventricosum]RZR72344.1 hypothetical protein BHM03_00012748 [Ensete ventricosum]
MRSLALPSPCSSSPACLFDSFLPPTSRRRYRFLRFLSPQSAVSPRARLPLVPLCANPLRSTSPIKEQLSDTDEDEEDDDDDEVTAMEYDDGLLADVDQEDEEREGETALLAAEAGPSAKFEEHKWERVTRLLAEVREFGEEIIDYEELAGIYEFPIDKFQVLYLVKSEQSFTIQAFLRGSSVVVSAPTSSGKTLIAEAAAVATVARGRRLFYTTPLKALSNQKFRDFRYILVNR